MPTRHYCLWLVAAALLLGGCSNTTQQEAPKTNAALTADFNSADQLARLQELKKQNDWRLRGKIGLRSPSKNGSGFIDWQQEGENFRLQVSGPLGQGSTIISGNKEQLFVQGAEENLKQNAQEQAARALGWPLPQQEMPYWVRGAAAPGEAHQAQWSNGLLQQLNQSGWKIEYSRYSRHPVPLPEKIKLTRDDIRLTLVIKRWQ